MIAINQVFRFKCDECDVTSPPGSSKEEAFDLAIQFAGFKVVGESALCKDHSDPIKLPEYLWVIVHPDDRHDVLASRRPGGYAGERRYKLCPEDGSVGPLNADENAR